MRQLKAVSILPTLFLDFLSSMCGISGYIGRSLPGSVAKEAVDRMCDHMHSRGPDAGCMYVNERAGLVLGHRRLSILDLSNRSNQPMESEDGNHVIVFNGEIYNFAELRTCLEGKGEVFRTTGDTEVLLKLYQRYGEQMLPKLRGMFAIAIWEKNTNSVMLARDPYGIKPLYVSSTARGCFFASQVKALLASGHVSDQPNPQGQLSFWLLGCVLEPHTWFSDIRAVPAGSVCRVFADGSCSVPKMYWDINCSWRGAARSVSTFDEVVELVTAAVSSSVKHHLVSDVPIGVFLSGGVDSAALTGLLSELGGGSITGITLSFDEFRNLNYDEAPLAKMVANHYGVRHHVRRVNFDEFKEDFPKIIAAMDQPSIDGINTWFASKAAAELGLKVVVSGIGGDELFGGYNSFRQVPNLVSIWNSISNVPGARWAANFVCSKAAKQFGKPKLSCLPSAADSLYGAYWLRRGLFTPGEVRQMLAASASQETADPASIIEQITGRLNFDRYAGVGQMETSVYLRNQLLRDADWASMAHSVELRCPLVDAFLLRDLQPVLRSFKKINGKKILGCAPSKSIPLDVITKRKTGFGTPLGSWIAQLLGAHFGFSVDSVAQGGAVSRSWAHVVTNRIY